MDALDRGRELMRIPMSKLPKEAINYGKDLFSRVGGCGGAYLTVYTTYAQLIEGLKCSDPLYIPSEYEKERFWESQNGN